MFAAAQTGKTFYTSIAQPCNRWGLMQKDYISPGTRKQITARRKCVPCIGSVIKWFFNPMETPLDKLNARLCSEQLHTKFKVRTENTPPVELELCEVSEPATLPRLELFTLVFRGPAALRLPQRIHLLEHPKLGTLPIFLTAIDGDSESISYEAVFNRVRDRKK